MLTFPFLSAFNCSYEFTAHYRLFKTTYMILLEEWFGKFNLRISALCYKKKKQNLRNLFFDKSEMLLC